MGKIDSLAVQSDVELVGRLCPKFTLPEILEPEVMVALQVADVSAGTAEFGEFGQRTEPELGNCPAILKPELEQITQDVEGLRLAAD